MVSNSGIPFVNHSRMKTAYSELLNAIQSARSGTFVWALAPSGSGKSEIRQAILPALAGKQSCWPAGTLPLISVRAMANDRGKFNSKDLTLRMHHAVVAPDFGWLESKDRSISTDAHHLQAEVEVNSELWRKVRATHSQPRLQHSFEAVAKQRQLKYIFLEEAATLTMVHLHQSSYGYMSNLVRLIEEIGCVMVMLANHTAESLWAGHPDVWNRSRFVYIRPYNLSNPQDERDFVAVLKGMGQSFRLEDPKVLVKNVDLMYANGAGVFGPTIDVVHRAELRRKNEGASTITEAHLHASSSSERDLGTVWSSVHAFNKLADQKPLNGAKRIADFLKRVGTGGPES